MLQIKKKWKRAHTNRLLKLMYLYPTWFFLYVLEVLRDSLLYLIELIHNPIVKAKKEILKIIRRHHRSIKGVLNTERSEEE